MSGKARFAAGHTLNDSRQARGRTGEAIARRHLRRRRYAIIQTNFRTRYGEIDIIARRGSTIIFVEVKARRSRRFGEPFEAVGPRKQQQLKRMAEMWLAARQGPGAPDDCIYRFDVISIMLGGDGRAVELRHIKNAF